MNQKMRLRIVTGRDTAQTRRLRGGPPAWWRAVIACLDRRTARRLAADPRLRGELFWFVRGPLSSSLDALATLAHSGLLDAGLHVFRTRKGGWDTKLLWDLQHDLPGARAAAGAALDAVGLHAYGLDAAARRGTAAPLDVAAALTAARYWLGSRGTREMLPGLLRDLCRGRLDRLATLVHSGRKQLALAVHAYDKRKGHKRGTNSAWSAAPL